VPRCRARTSTSSCRAAFRDGLWHPVLDDPILAPFWVLPRSADFQTAVAAPGGDAVEETGRRTR